MKLEKFLEQCYKLCNRQMTVFIQRKIQVGEKKAIVRATFIYPPSDRVAADRKKQKEAKEDHTGKIMPWMVG